MQMEIHGLPVSGFPVPYSTPGRDVNQKCNSTPLLSLTNSRYSQSSKSDHTSVILVSH